MIPSYCFNSVIYSVAQYVGMAKEITATVPAAKLLFEKASDILGYNLLAKVRRIVLLITIELYEVLQYFRLFSVWMAQNRN